MDGCKYGDITSKISCIDKGCGIFFTWWYAVNVKDLYSRASIPRSQGPLLLGPPIFPEGCRVGENPGTPSVNSLYSEHCRDLELVSSLARILNSRSLFQSNVCKLFLTGIKSCCPYYYRRDANPWRSKIWGLFFFYCPPGISTDHAPRQIDPAANGNDLGHYMKSYMNYILSKFAIIVWIPDRIFVDQWLNTCKNAPETVLRKKKFKFWAKNGLNLKLRHRKAQKMILSRRYGDPYGRSVPYPMYVIGVSVIAGCPQGKSWLYSKLPSKNLLIICLSLLCFWSLRFLQNRSRSAWF